MKLQIALVAGLMSVSSFAGYQPRWFNIWVDIKNKDITPGILVTTCENAPMYFTLPDGSRDYVKDVTFNVSQRKNGTYDVDYDITSHTNNYTIQTKGKKQDGVEPILQKTFPQVFTSTGEQYRYWLRDLEKNETARAVFKNVVDLMNGFLPQTTQLKFDEKDFSEIQFYEWRAWLSPKAWRSWWQWERERNKNR